MNPRQTGHTPRRGGVPSTLHLVVPRRCRACRTCTLKVPGKHPWRSTRTAEKCGSIEGSADGPPGWMGARKCLVTEGDQRCSLRSLSSPVARPERHQLLSPANLSPAGAPVPGAPQGPVAPRICAPRARAWLPGPLTCTGHRGTCLSCERGQASSAGSDQSPGPAGRHPPARSLKSPQRRERGPGAQRPAPPLPLRPLRARLEAPLRYGSGRLGVIDRDRARTSLAAGNAGPGPPLLVHRP